MLKCKFLYLFILIAFLASGCSTASIDTTSKIVAPVNKSSPLQGKWKITQRLGTAGKARADAGQWGGRTAEFGKDTAVLGDSTWEKVNYKVKRVNAEEYFLYKFNYPVEKLGIKEKELIVTTVFSEDKFLYEFVRVNDNEIIAIIDKELLKLEKLTESAGDLPQAKTEASPAIVSSLVKSQNKTQLSSGLLLGIRSSADGTVKQGGAQSQSQSYDEYTYRTLWIALIDGKLRPVLEADNLFMPRKSGFWRVEARRSIGAITEDQLYASSVDGNVSAVMPDSGPYFLETAERDGVLRKKILYAGNDYISVELEGEGGFTGRSGSWKENRLSTIPVDNLQNEKGINISDIAGENGEAAVKRAVSDFMNTKSVQGVKELSQWSGLQSFGLFRKTGHWFIKGRINLGDGQPSFQDLNLNIIPPRGLVAYDVLQLSWTYIKDRIPQAVDAFTSPSCDVAVIIVPGQVLVYSIKNGSLSPAPLSRLSLKENDSVVMAEWATGNYTDKWEKEFTKYNSTREVPSSIN